MSLEAKTREELICQYGKNEKDVGSMPVQVALLTQRIQLLSLHFKNHPKDYSSQQGLLKLVGQRRRFLKYLKTKHKTYSQYIQLIQSPELKIRK